MQLNERIGRRLRLRDLNVFLVVAAERSMSKAAVQLAISQPAVSKAIAEMELTLGVPLLDRGPRGVEPTLFGRALLKRSAAIFDELRQTVTDIDSLLDPTAGEARSELPGPGDGLPWRSLSGSRVNIPASHFTSSKERSLRCNANSRTQRRALGSLVRCAIVDEDLDGCYSTSHRLSLQARDNGLVGGRSRLPNCSMSPGFFLHPAAYRLRSFPMHSSPPV